MQNGLIIADYVLAAKHESSSMSDNYRMSVIRTLSYVSIFTNNKSFKSMTRQDVLSFLDHIRKPEGLDPNHKWIGTYNLYVTILTKFFKWLYYADIPPQSRPKPSVVENISRQRRKEISIYKPTDLWSEEEDSLFLKYCASKRIKCYHTISRDTSCRPHELLKLKIRDIMFKLTPDRRQYAEVSVNGKTGSRSIPLINSIPYVKDYLDHEHPQPGNPNAPFISAVGKSLGRHVRVPQLHKLYQVHKTEIFPRLLNSPNVEQEDKEKIRVLLKKPWNPYVRRHTGLTEKSLKIPGLMNQYAGWSEGSKMPQKYLHYFGDESSKSLAYGIVSNDQRESYMLKPKQCPNCNEPNKPDSKFCAKCRMVLTYDAYSETLEKQQEKESEISRLRQDVKAMTKDLEPLLALRKTLEDQGLLKVT